MSVTKKLNALEAENAKLKKITGRADDLRVNAEGDARKEYLRPDARRRAVDWDMN